MTKLKSINLFKESNIRTVWDDENEKWYFSIVDIIETMVDCPNSNNYWKVMKHRLKRDGNESVTNCNQLKMRSSDGKMYKTDVADIQQLFRIIQVIPSAKAEPFKQWMAELAAQRLNQLNEPLLSINQAMIDFKRLNYSDSWINQRLQSMEVRKEVIEEWNNSKEKYGEITTTLTDIIHYTWLEMTKKKKIKIEHKKEVKTTTITNPNVMNLLAEFSNKPIE